MTARLRLSCDGTWPQDPRPAEACRGAISLDLEAIADAAGLVGTDVIDVDAARELAVEHGWSCNDVGDYCPAHAARQARALAAALGFDLDETPC